MQVKTHISVERFTFFAVLRTKGVYICFEDSKSTIISLGEGMAFYLYENEVAPLEEDSWRENTFVQCHSPVTVQFLP